MTVRVASANPHFDRRSSVDVPNSTPTLQGIDLEHLRTSISEAQISSDRRGTEGHQRLARHCLTLRDDAIARPRRQLTDDVFAAAVGTNGPATKRRGGAPSLRDDIFANWSLGSERRSQH